MMSSKMIFDWKKNYRDLLQLPEFKDLKVFTVGRKISPFQLNPLIPPPGTEPGHWLVSLIDVMKHAFFLGEGVEYLLREAIDFAYKDFVLGTNAIYQAMIYDGTYMRFFPWIMDIRADDVESVTPGYYPEDVANYIVDAANIAYSFPWEHHYIGVWRSNQVLDNIEGIEFEDEDGNKKTLILEFE